MSNALPPNHRRGQVSAVFQSIDAMAPPFRQGEEQLGSPIAIFRDSENEHSMGGTTTTGSLHLVKRANPIDSSMDSSFSSSTTTATCTTSTTTTTTHDIDSNEEDDDDVLWTDAHQRVISPFPGDAYPDEMPQVVNSWNVDELVEPIMDFTNFFPSANAHVMECDDFSLSSASEEDLVLADDLANPESFWESASQLDRSASPAQISVASNTAITLIFPPSPTSTTQLPQGDLLKVFQGSAS